MNELRTLPPEISIPDLCLGEGRIQAKQNCQRVGGDGALALHVLCQSGEHKLAGLSAAINAVFGRATMDAVRVGLLQPTVVRCARPQL